MFSQPRRGPQARPRSSYKQLFARCVARLAEATGQTAETVESDLRAGRMLSGEEAVAYGLVHELLSRATDKS
jgi:ATP-dependent protease ClpP protease subunit